MLMAKYSREQLERATLLKEQELYEKEGYRKAIYLKRNLPDVENHLFAYLIDLNVCLLPVYIWAVEFLLILTGAIPPNYFDLLFYIMYGLLFATSCVALPLYTASTGGFSWGGRVMGLRLVRSDKRPAPAMKLVFRQLLGFGMPLMLFGYFFSVFGILAWWLVNGLVVIASPGQKTIFDWLLGLVDVYKPEYKLKIVRKNKKGKQHAAQTEPAEQPVQKEPAAAPALAVGKIDLHVRSNYSDDANVDVEEIFRQAKEKGLEIISITDHNNARANAQAERFASLYKIRYIPGVEIDCQLYGEHVRILGYYINWNDPFFDAIERLSLKREKDVSLARIQAFEKATGIKVDTDAILARSRFKILKPRELTDLVFETPGARQVPCVKSYLDSSMGEKDARERFCKDYFGPGGKCEIKTDYPSALKVIDAIHKAGGMAILACWHLDRISNDVIEGLIDGGLDGFEVFSPDASENTKAFLLRVAKDEKLFATAGSDYHGSCRPDRQLGVTGASPKAEQIVRVFTRPVENADPQAFASVSAPSRETS